MKSNQLVLSTLCLALLAGCNNGDEGLLGGDNGDGGENTNVAPEAREVATRVVEGSINEPATPSVTLQVTGQYFDADDDLADTHRFRWLRDGETIEGATQSAYTIKSDFTSNYHGCVTPIAQTGVREGAEVCAPISDNGLIEPPPPNTVVPSAMPTITGTAETGNTISSVYTYNPEGGSEEGSGSEFYWLVYDGSTLPTEFDCKEQGTVKAGNACELVIEGDFTLKTIQSCVVPQNLDGVYGAVACTNVSGINVAPVANDVEIILVPSPEDVAFIALQTTFRYTDVDGDYEDTHIYSWEKDGVIIEGATQPTYMVSSDFSSVYHGCVTPRAKTGEPQGLRVCAPYLGTTEPLPPIALLPSATPEIIGTPFVGETISSSYLFNPNGGSDEGDGSQFYWLVYEQEEYPTLKECTNSEGSVCELTIERTYAGKPILSCVEPQNQDGVYGALSCVDTKGIGIEMRGSFVYGDIINATFLGISGEASWKVDTSTKLGFDSEGEPTLAPGTETVYVGDGDTISYTIGVNALALEKGMDLNEDGELTDVEWLEPLNDVVRAEIGVDAGNFIGKDIHLCISTEEYGEICVAASDYDNPYEEEFGYCTTPEYCVAGGLYQSNSTTLDDPVFIDTPIDATKLALTGKRGIEPIAEVELDGYLYHRPIFMSDFVLRGKKSLGLIPFPGRIASVNNGDTVIISKSITFGEELAAYSLEAYSQGVDFCKKFKGREEWYLPVAGKVSLLKPATLEDLVDITNDIYSEQGNAAVETYEASLFFLRENILRGAVSDEVNGKVAIYTPVVGWPLQRFATSSYSEEHYDLGTRKLVSYFQSDIAPQYVLPSVSSSVICSRLKD